MLAFGTSEKAKEPTGTCSLAQRRAPLRRAPLRRSVLLPLLTACLIALICTLIACAPRMAADNSPGADSFSAWAGLSDSDCLSCHNAAEPFMLSVTHQAFGASCFSCHDDATLAKVHTEHGDSGRSPTKLRYSEVPDNACLTSGCHLGREEVINQASDAAVIDDNGLEVNPHSLISNAGHDGLGCASCHTMHKEAKAITVTEERCFGCHHKRVFECGTCHD